MLDEWEINMVAIFFCHGAIFTVTEQYGLDYQQWEFFIQRYKVVSCVGSNCHKGKNLIKKVGVILKLDVKGNREAIERKRTIFKAVSVRQH